MSLSEILDLPYTLFDIAVMKFYARLNLIISLRYVIFCCYIYGLMLRREHYARFTAL